MQNIELAHNIEKVLGRKPEDLRTLPYQVLFETIGLNPTQALTVIPFLHRDPHYLSIPGKILRINNYGGLLNRGESSTSSSMHADHQATLPEIPLLPLDLRQGIPPNFREKHGVADLFIVNHGVILSFIDHTDPQAGNRYLASIKHATRPGSLLMIIDSPDETQFNSDQMAEIIGAYPYHDTINPQVEQMLNRSGLRRRKLTESPQYDTTNLGDYIHLPEAHQNNKIFFYRKT